MPIFGVRTRLATSLFGAAALSISLLSAPAIALDASPTEKEDLKTCEKNLCAMILSKEATGDDLTCAISKTWAKDKIEKGAGTKSLSWGFGDAQCKIDLTAARSNIVSSLTAPEHKLEMKSHTVKCAIEQGEDVTNINVTLAPKVTFKDGKAQKAELNITKVDAPAVIGTVIKGAAWVEKNFSLFHGEMIDEINDFVHNKCAKRYPDLASK
ncbi:MAG: hypothetical protein K0U74_12990 [Alphaproteobacteria bacterium]|nr:hypothetical protein [Alphaproteobacteria bacterium]